MKVRAIVNLGSNDYPDRPLKEGDEADVPDDIGALLVKRGHAVEIAKTDKFSKARAEHKES